MSEAKTNVDANMPALDRDLAEGARNLLINCAGMVAGETLLILHEDPALGWYDLEAPRAVARVARELGILPMMIEVGGPCPDMSLPDGVAEAMTAHCQTVFFSRLGDQSRFRRQSTARAPVMCYAANAEMLASPYGRFDHRAFLDVKTAVNAALDDALEIRITCPLGTDVTGRATVDESGPEDVSVKRFPMGVYKPIPCTEFSGKVALNRFLVTTGSRPYEPDCVLFEGTVFAHIEGTRITGFDGPAESVAAIEKHYRAVSDLFGIEPMFVHSWHSGIHPACRYRVSAFDHPDRWGNLAFTNPRVLHFHTCGAYPPGEISWCVIDPRVEIDGRVLWREGRLQAEASPEITDVLGRWPGLRGMFEGMVREIGV